ncbi:caveolin-1 isoform X2 [Larimichthys crocea]|uniref:caveolin-1 isoform X2 n=1 Tax=Larimichthys crocea TaxID=215358 RepID=UPI000F5FAA9E|nr:caveolin-1 isoform X2 [Larimichthys crocea]
MDENEAQITVESQTMTDIDNRDPKEIHAEGARVEFADVIAEPDGLHSLDFMWKVSYHTFTQTRRWIYRFFTLILGFPLSLIWGLQFACLSFLHIWIVTPCLRTIQFNFYCLVRPLLQLIRVCLLPLFRVTGKILSKVKLIIRKEA